MQSLTRIDEEERLDRLVEDIEEPTLVSVMTFLDGFAEEGFAPDGSRSFVDAAYRELLTDGQRERVVAYWSGTVPA